MIKVTVGEQKTQEENKKYPLLMKNSSGHFCLVTFVGEQYWLTGPKQYTCDIISSVADLSDFDQPITLTNE